MKLKRFTRAGRRRAESDRLESGAFRAKRLSRRSFADLDEGGGRLEPVDALGHVVAAIAQRDAR